MPKDTKTKPEGHPTCGRAFYLDQDYSEYDLAICSSCQRTRQFHPRESVNGDWQKVGKGGMSFCK